MKSFILGVKDFILSVLLLQKSELQQIF